MEASPRGLRGAGDGSPRESSDVPVRSKGDPTPHLRPWAEVLVRLFAVLTLLYSAYYIIWRWGWTLNWDAWWFSIPLVTAETYVLFSALLTTFTVWTLNRRTSPPAPEGLDVDVFITTYDEPLEIIRRTVIGARAIRYPHRTFILDDGKRDALRELASELGVGYIRRQGNEHAKAGNLNNALKETSGEFILQLDADHVPLPHMLDSLLGFFEEPDVAFVQSPQDFYNTNSFSYSVNEKGRRLWEEQRIFFSLLQPGKDHWNAAFFCGSCGVIRRTAIEEIGGFSTETITEDMETSLVLHSRGWKSIYYGESLAYGLAPASAGQYMVQRLRWGQGSMQVLRKYNPLFRKGLTWPQRICYFDSTISYLDGPLKLILYVAPIIFFFTGVLPIWVDEADFLIRFIPYLLLNLAMFELLFRGTGFMLIAERYNMAKFWIYTMAIRGFFARGKLKFEVTPKTSGDVPLRSYLPQLVLLVVSILAVVWGTVAYARGWIEYSAPGWGSGAFWFNFLWIAYNVYFAAYVVRLSLEFRQQRVDERFRALMAVEGEIIPSRDAEDEDAPEEDLDDKGLEDERARRVVVLTTDLNPEGMGFRAAERFHRGSRVRFVLPLETRPVEVRGEVVHREKITVRSQRYYDYGVRLDPLAPDDRDAIDLHCTHHAVPLHRLQFRDTKRPLEPVRRLLADPRRAARQTVRLPAHVFFPDEHGAETGTAAQLGYLEEMSSDGARLILSQPPPPGGLVRFTAGTVEGEGEAVAVHAMDTPMGIVFSVGLRRLNGSGPIPAVG
ncbi:MAG: glycosyltransferase [Gemmatimonadetes bacterium]|nr:glycosyltransferase [Gemmatimonadota bacterium]